MTPPPSARHALPAWLLAAALALPLLGLSSPLLEVDDARYAEIPRAMAASGDWIVPELNGMPYVEKPPLWYWLAAVSETLLGPREAAARLPLFLLALLGAAGVWWLGSWLYSATVARVATTATATAALWLFLSHNITLDLSVSVFLLWTTALALRSMARPQDAGWAAPAAWVAAAFAFLSKGLIAVLLPGLWVAGLAFLFPALRPGAKRLASPAGLLAFLVLTAPWLIAMHHRRPDFLRTFFLEQHFQRYLTPRYARGAPWWFFGAVLPAGLLPWTAPALAGIVRAANPPLWSDFRGPALAAWVLGVTAFFSASNSKLATYVLPAVPHACLLAAVAINEGLPAWANHLQRTLGAMLLSAAALLGAALASGKLPSRLWPPPGLAAADAIVPAVLAALILIALGGAMIAAPSSHRPAAVLAGGGVLAGLFLFPGLRAAAPLLSAKTAALAVGAEAGRQDQVWTYGTYLHGLPFYSGRRVDKAVYFVGEFHYAKRDPAHAGRFGDDNDVRRLPRREGKTFVLMRSPERARFEQTVSGGATAIASWREFGPWSLAEVRARALDKP